MPEPQQNNVSATVIAQMRSLSGAVTASAETGLVVIKVAIIGMDVVETEVDPLP